MKHLLLILFLNLSIFQHVSCEENSQPAPEDKTETNTSDQKDLALDYLGDEEWSIQSGEREKRLLEKIKIASDLFVEAQGKKLEVDPRPADKGPDQQGKSKESAKKVTAEGEKAVSEHDAKYKRLNVSAHDRMKFAKQAELEGYKILEELNDSKEPKFTDQHVLRFLSHFTDMKTVDMVAVAMGVLNKMSCENISDVPSVVPALFRAASVIFLGTVFQTKLNYERNTEKMYKGHKSEDGSEATMLAMEANVHVNDEEISFTDKIIKAREIYQDMLDWIELYASFEHAEKMRRVQRARHRKSHHKNLFKTYRGICYGGLVLAAVFCPLRFDQERKYKRWRKNLSKAKNHTHMSCKGGKPLPNITNPKDNGKGKNDKKQKDGDESKDEKNQKDVKSKNPEVTRVTFIDVFDFFLAGAFAEANPAKLSKAIYAHYITLQEENHVEMATAFVSPGGRMKYFADLKNAAVSGIPELKARKEKLHGDRFGNATLYKSMRKRLKTGSKSQLEAGKKVNLEASKKHNFDSNGNLACVSCNEDLMDSLKGGSSFGGELSKSTDPKSTSALGNKFRKRSEIIGKYLKEHGKTKLNAKGDDLIVPENGRGLFSAARKKTMDKLKSGVPDGLYGNENSNAPDNVEDKNLVKDKVKSNAPTTFEGGDSNGSNTSKSVSKDGLNWDDKDEEQINSGNEEMNTAPDSDEDTTSFSNSDINPDKDIPIWKIITRRYMVSGYPRLLKRRQKEMPAPTKK